MNSFLYVTKVQFILLSLLLFTGCNNISGDMRENSIQYKSNEFCYRHLNSGNGISENCKDFVSVSFEAFEECVDGSLSKMTIQAKESAKSGLFDSVSIADATWEKAVANDHNVFFETYDRAKTKCGFDNELMLDSYERLLKSN